MTASSGVMLSNLAYLIGAVVLAFIGGLIVWLHHRQPKSVDANVESFNRGLRALAPDAPSPGSRRAAAGPPAGPRIEPRPVVRTWYETPEPSADPAEPEPAAPAEVPKGPVKRAGAETG